MSRQFHSDWTRNDSPPFVTATASAAIDLVQTYWHLGAPSRRTLTCGLYRTAAGLEVRAGYRLNEPLLTRLAPHEQAAACCANEWKALVVATGRFVVVNAPPS